MRKFQFQVIACHVPRIAFGAVLLTLLSAVGCGGGPVLLPTATVSGKVTFEGAPVTEGEVNFASSDGYAATVPLDSSGSFSIESLEVGSYTVFVTPPSPTEAPGSEPDETSEPKQYDNIPQGYRQQTTSDLVAEVKEGDGNTFTFDLKTGGGIPPEETEGGAP